MSVCIFCFTHESSLKEACSYGMHHELEAKVVKQVKKKANKLLCTKCGLHPKNPLFATNGCSHEQGDASDEQP